MALDRLFDAFSCREAAPLRWKTLWSGGLVFFSPHDKTRQHLAIDLDAEAVGYANDPAIMFDSSLWDRLAERMFGAVDDLTSLSLPALLSSAPQKAGQKPPIDGATWGGTTACFRTS